MFNSENRVTFQIKYEYYLGLLTLRTIKLLGNTEEKITKSKNGEKRSQLEISEVVSVHCNIVNTRYEGLV